VPEGPALPEGEAVTLELEHAGQRVTVHAVVANLSADGREVGLQFLLGDEAGARELAALVDSVLTAVAHS